MVPKNDVIYLVDGELLRYHSGLLSRWMRCADCRIGRWVRTYNLRCTSCEVRRRTKNLTGQKFGRLLVLGWPAERPDGSWAIWECLCDCGRLCLVRSRYLRDGTRSCGCLMRERMSQCATKHGAYRTTEYQIWCSMIKRCRNPRNAAYRLYGGRGIKVCERWRKFENFFADIGSRPKGLTLDRIDNDGNYEPGNCRWATRSEQSLNSRPSIAKRKREAAISV